VFAYSGGLCALCRFWWRERPFYTTVLVRNRLSCIAAALLYRTSVVKVRVAVFSVTQTSVELLTRESPLEVGGPVVSCRRLNIIIFDVERFRVTALQFVPVTSRRHHQHRVIDFLLSFLYYHSLYYRISIIVLFIDQLIILLFCYTRYYIIGRPYLLIILLVFILINRLTIILYSLLCIILCYLVTHLDTSYASRSSQLQNCMNYSGATVAFYLLLEQV